MVLAVPTICCTCSATTTKRRSTTRSTGKFLDDYFRKFADDWDRWKLADTFGNMENYFRQCVAMEAGGRLLGTSAIRSNPHVISHSLTACHDTVLAAEGLITSFREPKPGVHDAMFDAWSPLRFCVFAEPIQVVRGGPCTSKPCWSTKMS